MRTTDEVRAKVAKAVAACKANDDVNGPMAAIELLGMAVESLGEIAFALHEINVRGGGQ